MVNITKEQKQKLLEIYKNIATPKEIDELKKRDKLLSIESSVNESSKGINKVIEGLKDFFNKRIDNVEKKIKPPTDLTPLLEVLSDVKDKVGNIKLQERIDRDYSPAYKMMIDKLSSVDEKIGGWKFPQYAYTGLRNKNFSPINPKNNGLGIEEYDYVSLSQTTLTDIYTFKQNGASGTTVSTVTITYTGTDKGTISNVIRT